MGFISNTPFDYNYELPIGYLPLTTIKESLPNQELILEKTGFDQDCQLPPKTSLY